MTGLLPVLALGFFLGMRHATDPDHVIAVGTFVSRERSPRGAALIGLVWGLGHTLTIVLVGGGIIVFRWVIPPRVGLSMELAVGVMLIALGIMNLSGVLRRIGETVSPGEGEAGVHSHPHRHGDYIHSHPHRHDPEVHPHRADQTPVGWLDRHLAPLRLYQMARPLLVGMVHGLAGSAAVALLVLPTITDSLWSVLYLAVFGAGTIVGMTLITAAIAVPIGYSATRFARVNRSLRLAAGVLSLGFGLLLAYRIGFVDGLFGSNPRWDPH
jgi:high-affinity nickel-transport protein